MSRIDTVLKRVQELYEGQGLTTIEIASSLGLSRANVSNDLNRLCDQGKVIKKRGKPALFTPVEIENNIVASYNKEIKEINTLDSFVEKNKNLYSAAEQAKAAILYPPNGMNMLILGETGVGKSMFVSLIHRYAIEMKKFKGGSPFITFNCADYATNPQLLLAQLFGSKKGAYTGAETDKTGLIEKANEGILFLDEVHRLPSEGQEMLFTFMDKGVYRRLGETEKENKSKVLIICATTEDPKEALLQTFTRRIPMIITIPPLSKRTIEERFELIATFMKEESSRLDKEIKVSINSIKALLSYDCPNNIGQLKADIQLICAKIYAQYVSKNINEIKINSLDLPVYIRSGLYKEVEHRQLWNKLIDINKKYCIFNNTSDSVIFEDYKEEINIYEMVEVRYRELKSRNIEETKLQEIMKIDIESYFKKYIHKLDRRFNSDFDISKLENIIEYEILNVIVEILQFSEECLNRQLSQKVCYGMAIHINSSIERIRANKKITNPQLNKIRVENKEEFNVALDCLRIIEKALDISMPIDEAGFLGMFLSYDNKKIEDIKKEVKVIVLAHGESTATSMADVANKLLGSDYVVGINAQMDKKPESILERLKSYIRDNKITSEILLLVDMGSLTTFGREIEKEFKIKTRVIPLVSTLHTIEAARKAMMGYSIDEVVRGTFKVNELYKDKMIVKNEHKETRNYKFKKLAILSICTTGDGGAKSIETLLSGNLNYDENILQIIPMNLIDSEEIENRIYKLSEKYEIVAIISTFKIDTEIYQLSLEDIFVGNGVESLQNSIDIETAYIKMSETLEQHLKHISGECVLEDIKCFNTNIQNKFNIKIETNRLIGITLHIACMLDRLQDEVKVEEFIDKERFIKDNIRLFNIVEEEMGLLVDKYYSNTRINTDEICYIMSLFKGTFNVK